MKFLILLFLSLSCISSRLRRLEEIESVFKEQELDIESLREQMKDALKNNASTFSALGKAESQMIFSQLDKLEKQLAQTKDTLLRDAEIQHKIEQEEEAKKQEMEKKINAEPHVLFDESSSDEESDSEAGKISEYEQFEVVLAQV